MNHFLSLTPSHHYSCRNTFTPALTFPSVTRSASPFQTRFVRVLCPLRSVPVCLVIGDGQHMARLWDRACPAESTGLFRRLRRCVGCSARLGSGRESMLRPVVVALRRPSLCGCGSSVCGEQRERGGLINVLCVGEK